MGTVDVYDILWIYLELWMRYSFVRRAVVVVVILLIWRSSTNSMSYCTYAIWYLILNDRIVFLRRVCLHCIFLFEARMLAYRLFHDYAYSSSIHYRFGSLQAGLAYVDEPVTEQIAADHKAMRYFLWYEHLTESRAIRVVKSPEVN